MRLVYSSDWKTPDEAAGQAQKPEPDGRGPDLTMALAATAAVIGLVLPMLLWMWIGSPS